MAHHDSIWPPSDEFYNLIKSVQQAHEKNKLTPHEEMRGRGIDNEPPSSTETGDEEHSEDERFHTNTSGDTFDEQNSSMDMENATGGSTSITTDRYSQPDLDEIDDFSDTGSLLSMLSKPSVASSQTSAASVEHLELFDACLEAFVKHERFASICANASTQIALDQFERNLRRLLTLHACQLRRNITDALEGQVVRYFRARVGLAASRLTAHFFPSKSAYRIEQEDLTHNLDVKESAAEEEDGWENVVDVSAELSTDR